MRPMLKATLLCAAALIGTAAPAQQRASGAACDRVCLEKIGDQYRAAFRAHDPSKAPISRRVRFTENFVEMPFPDGTWDTVSQEVGEPLTLSDPVNGQVGIYTRIMQNDTPGYLAIRLKVEGELITEIEHIISTKRNLSAPPTPIADFDKFSRAPHLNQPVPKAKCRPRAEMVRLADGYFETLENNTGEIRGTRFSPTATRTENGMNFPEIEKGFKSGRYYFNDRVRDRDHFLVDEYRCMVMSRGFIDHKGVIDQYKLADGTPARSIFREPHSWALLESFKLEDGMITGVEAVFIASAYNMRSPWTVNPDVIRAREAKYPKR